jgi:hypothetical protein
LGVAGSVTIALPFWASEEDVDIELLSGLDWKRKTIFKNGIYAEITYSKAIFSQIMKIKPKIKNNRGWEAD